MDNDYALDIDQIIRTIESAEVVTFRFMLLEKRLLIDNRTNEIDGPMARLVNRVGSSEERFRSIRRMRPRFGLPDKLTAIWWPKYIRTLEITGVWDAVVRRMEYSGFPNALQDCQAVLKELYEMERKEIRGAIVGGEGFQTVWSAKSAS